MTRVVFPLLSRPTTRMRASFLDSPKIDANIRKRPFMAVKRSECFGRGGFQVVKRSEKLKRKTESKTEKERE